MNKNVDIEMYEITTEFIPRSSKMVMKDYLEFKDENPLSYSYKDQRLDFKIL